MRIAIVTPRYGAEIGGGAETQAREFAEEAVRQGWTVEVWTTCARDHYTWANEWPAGRSLVNGVPVVRFPLTEWAKERQGKIGLRVAAYSPVAVEQQYAWLHAGPHSAALYAHVAQQQDKFDCYVMLPYLSPLVHYAAWAAPEHTILWPCLHAEPQAGWEPVRLLLSNVRGVMFNTHEEASLAGDQLQIPLRRSAVLGEGVATAGCGVRNAESRTPHPALRPDLLYIGRLEEGKNIPLLYRYVRRYVDEGKALRLVVMGSGPFVPPRHPAFDFRGYAPEAEKVAACAAALALCQPSHNESFSRVIMESWLAGRPVLVNENCLPTRGHVQRSKGGLAFRDYSEFAAAVDWLQANPTLADQMGRNGQRYVQQNYTWPLVVERFAALLTRWQAEAN